MTRNRLKTTFVALILGTLAFVGLGSWALSSPIGASPDDDFHLASIWCALGDREGLCAPGNAPEERVVPERLVEPHACYAFDSDESAACQKTEGGYISTARGNFEGIYPPVFYGTLGVFASADIAGSTVVMRLFNVTLFVGAVTALFLMLRRGERGPIVWGTAVAFIPLGAFIVPSVNPSSWAFLSAATLWIAMLGYFRADRRRPLIGFGVGSVILAVMGAGARGDSAAYVALASVLVMVLTFERNWSWMRRAILPLGIIVTSAAFFLSSSQSSESISQGADGPGMTFEEILEGVLMNLPNIQSLWVGNLGTWGLGWLDTPMPPLVWATMIAVYGAVVLHGLRFIDSRKVISLALVAAGLVLLPMYILVRDQVLIGEYVQPRYVLPLMVLFAGVAVYGNLRDDLGLTRVQAGVIFAGIAIANSAALHTNLRRYVTGLDFYDFNLDSSVEWWWSIPISPMTVWVAGSVSFTLFLVGLMYVVFRNVAPRKVPIESAVGPSLLV